MKPVLLHILYNSDQEFQNIECDTVKEAQEQAEKYDGHKANFSIYTMFSSGARTTIDWNLATDHATNLRENTKKDTVAERKKSTRTGRWSPQEIATAVKARKEGMKIRVIAKRLGRSYNAVYCQLQKRKKK
jgi:hypothetical protein